MKHWIKNSFVLLGLVCMGIWGCSKSDIMYYEGGNAVHFMKTSQGLSFMTKMEAEKDTMQIRVLLVGNPVNLDREFAVEVVDDSTTTATPDQYRILKTVVPANDTMGMLLLEVSNPNYLNTNKSTLELKLKVVDNENFKAGGWLNYMTILLPWTTDVIRPQTWSAMSYFFTSKYSSNVYRAFVASTGLTEFWYFSPDPETGYQVSESEGFVLGKKFGDWIREYNRTHDDVYRHDDGNYKGEEIEPIH